MIWEDEEKAKALTVEELINNLKVHDPKAKVILEGCDCEGWAKGIAPITHADEITITRY